MALDNNELRRNGQFQSGHDGIYTCVVTDNGTNSTETLFIGLYSNYDDYRLTVTLIANASFNATDARLILDCSSTGLPATTVKWFFENQLITVGERMQLITDKRTTNYHSVLIIQQHELVLEGLQRNGRYICQVGSVMTVNASTNFHIRKKDCCSCCSYIILS